MSRKVFLSHAFTTIGSLAYRIHYYYLVLLTMKHTHALTSLSLAFLLAFSPIVSYAKENGAEKNKDRGPKVEHVDRTCLRAFGHLIAPGFIKNKTQVSLKEACWLPFGIKKKLNGTATSTPDTIAPIIKNLKVEATTTQAVISWQTNEKTNASISWSTTTPVSSAAHVASSTDTSFSLGHSVLLNGLTASTTYYFVAHSSDKAGNATSSAEGSFRTR